MLRIYKIVPFLLVMTGCAAKLAVNQADILQQAVKFTPVGKEMYYTHIPSHGAAGDAVAIASGGGANATKLRESLEQLESQGGGSIVVVSENPSLSKTIIISAINTSDMQFKNVWLVYAGDQENSQEIEKNIKDKGIGYGYVPLR